jgi:hypothetical protein
VFEALFHEKRCVALSLNHDPIDQRIENLHVNIEPLHSSVTRLYVPVHEQRLRTEEQARVIENQTAAIQNQTGAIQSQARVVETLVEAARLDGENIAALARIAESHERRLTRLEGGEEQ